MPQTPLVFATVLKPIDDPRMYGKLAVSLSQTNKYGINIIGFASKNIPQAAGIQFHPIFHFSRLSPKRILAPWRAFVKIMQLRPRILIICTHELLLPALLYRVFGRGKVIYDVQENYWRNILYTDAWPGWLKWPLATWVRAKEKASRAWVDHYILAEEAYATEISFVRGKFTLLQNKFAPAQSSAPLEYPIPQKKEGKTRLLISGSLISSYNILETITFTNQFSTQCPQIEWHIIGFAPDPAYREKIKAAAAGKNHLILQGIDQIVPHAAIIQAIKQADAAWIPYLPNKSTENCLPTRFFEYAWHQLPIIYPPNPLWRKFMDFYQAGICFEATETDFSALISLLQKEDFYAHTDKNSLSWASEEGKLLQLLNEV